MIVALNPVLTTPAAPFAVDPVFGLIEEHRTAHAVWAPLAATWNSLLLTDPAYAMAEEAESEPGDRVRAALSALVAARPTTLPGVLALAEYLPDAIRQVAIDEESDGERALRSVAAALRGLVHAAGADAAPDPVLGVIQASRQAQAEMEAFIAETREHRKLASADRGREGLLSTAQIATDAAVWATVPTTQVGRAALVDYARFQIRVRTAPDGQIDGAECFVEEIFTAFSAAIAAEQGGPVAALSGADGPLLAKAADFWSAFVEVQRADILLQDGRMTEEAWTPIYERVEQLRDELEHVEATTWLGLACKSLPLCALAGWQISSSDDPAADNMEQRLGRQMVALAASSAPGTLPDFRDANEAQALALIGAIEQAWAEDIGLRQGPDGSADTGTHNRQTAVLLRRDALIDAADRLSAETRAGRHAKVLVLAWFNRIETLRSGFPHDRLTRDGRFVGEVETALAALIGTGAEA